MAFVTPQYSRGEVNKAGDVLANSTGSSDVHEFVKALEVLANWRGAHAYPINTFQATLRSKLKQIDATALVAQRLKRTPSIIAKLQRFRGMQLARMQDIGGLRCVLSSMTEVNAVLASYKGASFTHERLPTKDYIQTPKVDGYRSIHLIYRYRNRRAPEYEGLSLELQVRTKTQHAWATAVETMGTYLGQALKSGQGDAKWKFFFKTASAALALTEGTAPVPGFENHDRQKVYAAVAKLEAELSVLNKLTGFAIATEQINTDPGSGAYHLIVLNSQDRSVRLTPFPLSRLDDANQAYANIEERAKNGAPLEAVLVSAGPVDALRKAYPNYFLDTQVFIEQVERIIAASKRGSK